MRNLAGFALLVMPTVALAGDDSAAAVARWRAREGVLERADLGWTVEGKGRLLRDLDADFEVRRGSDGGIEHHAAKGKPFTYRYASHLDVTRHPGYDRVAYEDASLNLIERRIDPIERAALFGPGLIAHGSATDELNPDKKTHPRGIVELQAVAVTADTPMAAMLRWNPLLGGLVSFPPEAAPFLAGTAPLDLRGLRAESIRRSPQGWTVRYRFAGDRIVPGVAERFSYSAEVTLADDRLPLRIDAQHNGQPYLSLATEGTRIWRGVRVPARVALHTPASKYSLAQNDVLWTLRSIAPTQRVDERRDALDSRPKATVFDWRLLGKDLDGMTFPPRGTPRKYAWDGRFPNLKELEDEPAVVWGEGSTEPTHAAAWPPFAIGAGAVVLATSLGRRLMRRRRGQKGIT